MGYSTNVGVRVWVRGRCGGDDKWVFIMIMVMIIMINIVEI